MQVFRKNWMFRLVGSQQFLIRQKQAEISIKAKGMSFEYTLEIDGKSLKRFIETQARNTRTWLPTVRGERHRVVLEIDTMEVFADGEKVEACVGSRCIASLTPVLVCTGKPPPIHTHTHAYTHTHTYAYTHNHTHTLTHTRTRTHTRIHTYAYTHTHTYTR